MESGLLPKDGLDMNDPANLALYTQIIVLASSLAEMETLFQDPNPQQQRAIQNWAHGMGYDYEYTLATRTARVVKPGESIPVTAADTNALELFDFDSYPTPEDVEADLGGTNVDPSIPDVSASEIPTHWLTCENESLWSQYVAPLETKDGCVETSHLHPPMHSSASNSPPLYSPRPEEIYPSYFADYENSIETDDTRTRKATEPRQSSVTSDLVSVHRSAAKTRSLEYTARDHPLYRGVFLNVDGLYHCPFEDDPKANCTHKPDKLKCNYDKFVDSHLRPYRCRVSTCKDMCFSSTACLLRHERVAHAMHGHGNKPFLCTYEDCVRAAPGNGFPRNWNLRDHMKRVHNDPGIAKNGSLYIPDHPSVPGLAESPMAKQTAPTTPQESICDPIQSKNNKNTRPLSPSSSHIGRARKMLGKLSGRRESVHSQASSGYQEVVFDSGSSRPSSPGTPGRRGPLDATARAAMKAVKAVKACWRCKFLRKTCSLDNPCLGCPTKSTNFKEKNWPAVGCNRGSFKEVLAPLKLCPGPRSNFRTFLNPNTKQEDLGQLDTKAEVLQTKRNQEYRSGLNTRAEVLQKALDASTETEPTTLISYIQSIETEYVDCRFEEFLQFSSLSPIPPTIRVAFTPLEECISAVVYEAVRCNAVHDFDLMYMDTFSRTLSQIVRMLYSAARYQARNDSNELIAQSIICLRGSFEAVRMYLDLVDFFGQIDHGLCKTDICHVDWIKNLDEHLNLYLDALSKVFFKKENMRTKETWWLSTFYSFAIQGLVRKLIWNLGYYPKPIKARKQYLHLAIRLFIASSGDYDPLMRDYASSSKGKETELSYITDLEEAKTAVEQDSWASKGILSSADYLRKLFEDNDRDTITDDESASAITSGKRSYKCPNVDCGKKFTRETALTRHLKHHTDANKKNEMSASLFYEKEMSSAAWPSPFPAYSGSRPYRPSSLSSMESSSDIGPPSPYTANAQNSQVNSDTNHSFPDYYQPGPGMRTDILYGGPIPILDRSMTDIYADELYNPSFSFNSEHSTTAQTGEPLLPSGVFTQRLQAANEQAGLTMPLRGLSLVRQDSPLQTLGNDGGISVPNVSSATAKELQEQQKAENDAKALQAHHQQVGHQGPPQDRLLIGENTMAQLPDTYDPMLDTDPFGLSASMQFPSSFSFDTSSMR